MAECHEDNSGNYKYELWMRTQGLGEWSEKQIEQGAGEVWNSNQEGTNSGFECRFSLSIF